jgi:hypothetical protein
VAADDPRTVAFHKAVLVLKAHAPLKRAVDEWFEWGEGKSLATADDPLPAGKTSVRLTPFAEAEEFYCSDGDTVTYQANVLVRLELRVRAFDATAGLNLYALVMDALGTPEGKAALRAGGVSWIEPVAVPSPASLDEQETAIAAVRLVVFITR